jgi:hypothetical protein
MRSVTLPDDFTGREVTCPSCHNTFEAPTRYNPTVLTDPVPPTPQVTSTPQPNLAVTGGSPLPAPPSVASTKTTENSLMSPEHPTDRPPPPPGLVPLSTGIPPMDSAPMPAGYTKTRSLVISQPVVAMLPLILLTLSFICTFFPWVGTYPNGSAVNTQGLWRTISGYPTRNVPFEGIMQTPPDWLDKVTSDWLMMIPYFFALLFAVAFAWVERLFHALDPRKLPPRLARVWPWMTWIITGLTVIALFFMLIQLAYGFGLERAMRQVVSDQFSKQREEVAGSPTLLFKVKYNEEQEYLKFDMERTSWLYLGVLCNFLAAMAVLCRITLEKRGSKPPPRIVIQY